MTIGDRIRILREQIDISQVDLASSVGITKQTLYKYENNIILNIPSNKIELLAIHLNSNPAYLMGWEEQSNNPTKISVDFSKEEQIIENYRLLNEEGKEKALTYIEDLVDTGKYKKSTQHKLEEKKA